MRNHPGRAITVFQMASIFTPSFYQAATIGRGVELFKCTGIVPWNPNIFTDADFLASSVTEREDPEERGDFDADTQDLTVSGGTISDLIRSIPVASEANSAANKSSELQQSVVIPLEPIEGGSNSAANNSHSAVNLPDSATNTPESHSTANPSQPVAGGSNETFANMPSLVEVSLC